MTEGDARRDGWIAAGVALVVRFVFLGWAAGRFPLLADGEFYDVLARRLSHGAGYTWLWPDGAITNVARTTPWATRRSSRAAYALFGAHVGVAMGINALFGAAMVLARSYPRSLDRARRAVGRWPRRWSWRFIPCSFRTRPP